MTANIINGDRSIMQARMLLLFGLALCAFVVNCTRNSIADMQQSTHQAAGSVRGRGLQCIGCVGRSANRAEPRLLANRRHVSV
jgi:hypothetical protein